MGWLFDEQNEKKFMIKTFIVSVILACIFTGIIVCFTMGAGYCIRQFLMSPEDRANIKREKCTTYIEKRSNYSYAEIKKVSHNSYEICDLETGVHYFLNGGWNLIGVNQAEMSPVYNADGMIKISNEKELNELRERLDLNTYMEEE